MHSANEISSSLALLSYNIWHHSDNTLIILLYSFVNTTDTIQIYTIRGANSR